MNLHIKQACHENWETMTVTERGKLCASCQKEVIDFATFSTSNIKLYIE